MRVHHLNCGSHCPLGGAIFDGKSPGLFANICTHCLLIETNAGLVLVDTGYGLEDVRRHHARLARLWPAVLNVQFDERATALRQVEALGFGTRDVRHIVLTHLDFDHAGGIADFPHARVHLMQTEHSAAQERSGFVGRQRYRPGMWSGVHDWRTYDAQGEPWFGFDAVRALDGLPPEILLVPLPGHTLGHAGVAVQTGDGWLLDAGDAYLHRDQMHVRPSCPWGLQAYQWIMDADHGARRSNQARIRQLKRERASSVTVFCTHDTEELTILQTRTNPQRAAAPVT